MNIAFLIDNDFVFHPDFLVKVLEKCRHPDRRFLVEIVTTQSPAPTFRQSIINFKRKLTFIGGIRGAWRLLVFLTKRRLARVFLGKSCFMSVQSACRESGVEYCFTDDANSEETRTRLNQFGTDVLFSLQGHLLIPETLHIPKIACINKHSGFLPKYRGVWPVFWTLLHGEKECGVTLHLMDEFIDSGPILLQQNFKIEANDSVFALYRKIFSVLPDMILEVIERLENNRVELKENSTANSTYFGFPKRSDVAKLRREIGRQVI